MYDYICEECGTKYRSPQPTSPPGIRWDDGHVCNPVSVKDKNEEDERSK